jgi:hypothetical protein
VAAEGSEPEGTLAHVAMGEEERSKSLLAGVVRDRASRLSSVLAGPSSLPTAVGDVIFPPRASVSPCTQRRMEESELLDSFHITNLMLTIY